MAGKRPGVVHLVGAGPGDPELMSVRAARLIAAADAIVHDRLIPAGALDGARPDAEVHDVGKRPGGPSTSQAEISALLVELARRHRSVVRLKGGDPFVFGRGGEEAQALVAAGIAFEVVPAITAGIAAAAFASIPVTQRGIAAGVALVSGHDADAGHGPDWTAIAAFPGTLVFYMGIATLPSIAGALLQHGRPADEPAAVIARGTMPGQRTVTATLAEIADVAARAGIRPPAVTIVGPVVALRDELAWSSSGG
jgi:uroporphyrinogen III methyltransferase / synthase